MNNATTIRQTYLVAHDFSECANAAADLALDDLLATRRGGRIVLAHVIQILVPPMPFEGTAIDIVALERGASADARKRLEAVADRMRALVGSASPAIEIVAAIRVGNPAQGIIDEAAAQNADRIIVGTHGRKGVSHLLLGSVAERVARLSTLPVVIAHAEARKSRAS